jgi:hypothetical protein
MNIFQSCPMVFDEDLLEDTEEVVREKLECAMCEYAHDGTWYFLPYSDLKRICQYDSVFGVFRTSFPNSPPETIERYIRYILGKKDDGTEDGNGPAIRLFAILVLIRKLSSIGLFIEERLKDRDLPFLKIPTSDKSWRLIRRQKNDIEDVHTFDGWGTGDIRGFYEKQWKLLAPYITKANDGSVAIYGLSQDAIMPWTERIPLNKLTGYGAVSKVGIHPDHHTFVRTHTQI